MPVKINLTKPVDIERLISEISSLGYYKFSTRPGEYMIVEDAKDEKQIMAVYDLHDAKQIIFPTIEERLEAAEISIKSLSEKTSKG